MLDDLGFYAGVQKEREKNTEREGFVLNVFHHNVLSKFDTFTSFN